jgi:hypothetical protein
MAWDFQIFSNLETNWTLNWILLHIKKKTRFFKGTMSVSQDLGSNSSVQYEKCVIDMWKD